MGTMPDHLRMHGLLSRGTMPRVAAHLSDPRVLVCGATGFVGRSLTGELVRQGIAVRALSRTAGRGASVLPKGVEGRMGDLVTGSGLDEALRDVTVAYYLVHSLGTRTGALDFDEADRQAASHFADAARRSGLQRIIYVGGLDDAAKRTSRHLASREEVGRILASSAVPVTQLRAGIVVGAGVPPSR